MDDLRKTLCQIPNACIFSKELLQICMDSAGEEDTKKVVKSLDKSGHDFIIDDCVYLQPGEEDAKKVVKSLDKSGQVFIMGDCVSLWLDTTDLSSNL